MKEDHHVEAPMTWWDSGQWHGYELEYGDAVGTRAALLAHASWETYVVDLHQDEAALWRDVRSSSHPIINRLARDHDFTITEDGSPRIVIEQCRALHREVAGRDTRSTGTWAIQARWLERGFARCFMAVRSGKPVGYAYVLAWGDWSYYFSAASIESNVQHALQWYAMKSFKASGHRWYEVGWADQPGDSKKERNICSFKSGFGRTVMSANWLKTRKERSDVA